MSDQMTAADAEKEFWDSLKKSNTGMLGLDQPGYHSQPMTAYREEETSTIWFFTRDDTDFARDVAVSTARRWNTAGSSGGSIWLTTSRLATKAE